LKLDCSKAITGLGWRPRWSLGKAIASVIEWTQAYAAGENVKNRSLQQIDEYMNIRAGV